MRVCESAEKDSNLRSVAGYLTGLSLGLWPCNQPLCHPQLTFSFYVLLAVSVNGFVCIRFSENMRIFYVYK